MIIIIASCLVKKVKFENTMYWQQTIYNKLKKVFLCFLVLISFFSCTKEEADLAAESQEYELLFYTPSSNNRKSGVLRHFLNVALGTEYGTGFQVTQKWTSEMNIFMGGNPSAEMLSELNLIKEEVNTYATDGFSMNIVNDSLQSNFYLFFGPPDDYVELFPEQGIIIDDNNNGLFHINMNSNFEIISGHMFVNIDISNSERRKHILREELTQSLGLSNDVAWYSNRGSIFYGGISSLTHFDGRDIEIIRLLYHPNMVPGLDRNMAESSGRRILGI